MRYLILSVILLTGCAATGVQHSTSAGGTIRMTAFTDPDGAAQAAQAECERYGKTADVGEVRWGWMEERHVKYDCVD